MHKKLLVGFISIFIILTVIFYNLTRDYAKERSQEEIKNMLWMHKAVHGYIEEIQKPVIYKLKQEEKLYKEFFAPEILSFTYIARGIKEYYNKERAKDKAPPFYFKLASDNPRNPMNKSTPFESQILKQMNEKKITEYRDIIEENGKNYLYVALPIGANKDSCMKCHSTWDKAPGELISRYGKERGFNEQVGHIRALISIKAPMEQEIAAANSVFMILTMVTFVALSLLYGLIIYFMNKINTKDKEIELHNEELELLNHTLEKRVEEETQKRLTNEKIAIQNAKMATMGEMVGSIIHQWRKPLSAISLSAENLADAYEYNELDANFIKAFQRDVANQIQYMSCTMDDFRNFFNPNRKKETFTLATVVKEACVIASPILNRYFVSVESMGNHDIMLTGVPNDLKQVLINLLTNSAEAIHSCRGSQGGIIKVIGEEDETCTILHLSDNGGGFSEDALSHLFSAYYTTKKEGTGLGLYMCRLLVEEGLHGSIEVSNGDGGAIFTLKFPR